MLQHNPADAIYLITGGNQNDGYPARWAPNTFAVAYIETTNEAIANSQAA